MIDTVALFKEKEFPKWFSSHPIFDKVKTIKKVFPRIGIPNFEQEVDLGGKDMVQESAKHLIKEMVDHIIERMDRVQDFIKGLSHISEERKLHSDKCLKLLDTVAIQLQAQNVIREQNGRITLKMPADITLEGDARPTFRADESAFRVYNKLSDLLKEGKFASLYKLENMQSFKTFSTENIPDNRFKIVFSSDGINGAWDIGTMSTRGIQSCQSWINGEYKHCTIGSVIDPFVGIIYMTSGAPFNKYGSKMIKRCIVRFVINGKTNKPYLLLDTMYPEYDSRVFKQFKKALQAKNANYDVMYGQHMERDNDLKNTYSPLNETRKLLSTTSQYGEDTVDDTYSIKAYQDTRIEDKESHKKDKQGLLFNKNSKNRRITFVRDFSKAFVDAFKNTEIDTFPHHLRDIVEGLKGKMGKKGHYDYYGMAEYTMPQIAAIIANEFVSRVNQNDCNTSANYQKKLYFSYFNNKKSVVEEVKTKVANEINGKIGLKGSAKLGARNTAYLIEFILNEYIDIKMKEKLRSIMKPHKLKQLPLP